MKRAITQRSKNHAGTIGTLREHMQPGLQPDFRTLPHSKPLRLPCTRVYPAPICNCQRPRSG